MPANTWRSFKVDGALSGIPSSGVSAVEVTFTVINDASNGWLKADKIETPVNSTVSYLFWTAGQQASGTGVVPVGTDGYIQVMTTSSTDLLVDVQGYYTAGNPAAGGYVPVTQTRLADTRTGAGFGRVAQLTNGSTSTIQVSGTTSHVPADASAVIVNFLVINQSAAGRLNPYPADASARPQTSISFGNNGQESMTATVGLGQTSATQGQMNLYFAGGTTDVAIDVLGYFTATASTGSVFNPTAVRVWDSRYGGHTPLTSGATTTIAVAGGGNGTLPGSGIVAVAANIIIFDDTGTTDSWVHAWPDDQTEPNPSFAVMYHAGDQVSNMVTLALGSDGGFKLHNLGTDSINYAIDIEGYYYTPIDRRTMLPGDAEQVGTLTPTLHTVFSDGTSTTGKILYSVYNAATNAVVATGSGPTVSAGTDSPWTVSPALAASTTYWWTATPQDSSGHNGSVSSTKFFNTEAADKLGQQRRFKFETRHLTDRLDMSVNIANGNLLLHATDLHIRGTGIDLTVDRYYNSLSTATSEMSKGWTLGIGQDVKLLMNATNPTSSDVTYVAPSGFSARFDYDSNGTGSGGTHWHHPPGVDADLSYDGAHSEWDLKFFPSEGKYVFNTAGQLTKEIDRNNNEIDIHYNTAGQMDWVKDTQHREVDFGYDTSGRLSSITDTAGNRTITYGYDSSGNLSAVTDAATNKVTYGYTGDLLTKITTQENSITQIDYDSGRRVTDNYGSYDPGNGIPTTATTTFDYNATSTDCPNVAGVTKETDPNGNSTTGDSTDGITTFCHDNRDRVTKVIDALGHKRSTGYNSNDNVANLTDALQQQTTLAWDPNDENLTSTSIPTGATSSFAYDDATHPHSMTGSTDPQGNTLGYTYDGPGNLHSETSTSSSPSALLLTIDHNNNGTVSKITDGDGSAHAISYGYDTNGNLTSVTNPAPLGNVTYTPDAVSRVHTMTDGNGQTTTYTYDNIDRPNITTFNDGSTVDQDYDGDGNLTKLTDNTGVTTFAYDKVERQIRKTLPSNEQLRYGYDHNGNLTSYTDSGGTINYTYNQVNLVTGAAEPGGDCTTTPVTNPCTTFQYDDNNRRSQTSYPTSPNRTVMNIGYDHSGRETSINTTVGATTLQNITYNYSKSGADTGLRQSMTDSGGTTSYNYDVLNRLTGASGALSRIYGYDLAFNRTSKTINSTQTNYSYNNANELTNTNNANTYNYDGNGNITSGNGGWSLSYNAKNQTTSATQPGGTALSPMVYSGTDQQERVQAGTTTYVNSALGVSSATVPAGSGAQTGGTGVTADAIIDGNPNQISTTYYTRDNRGNLVSMRDPSGSYYYLFDGLGSVLGLVNSSGAQVNTYSYDPYGEQLSSSQTVANPWRYASGQYDGTTGLTKFGVRYYNPNEGRFTQRDPSGKDLPYAYASADPANNTDPSGNWCFGGSFIIDFSYCTDDNGGSGGWSFGKSWGFSIGLYLSNGNPSSGSPSFTASFVPIVGFTYSSDSGFNLAFGLSFGIGFGF